MGKSLSFLSRGPPEFWGRSRWSGCDWHIWLRFMTLSWLFRGCYSDNLCCLLRNFLAPWLLRSCWQNCLGAPAVAWFSFRPMLLFVYLCNIFMLPFPTSVQLLSSSITSNRWFFRIFTLRSVEQKQFTTCYIAV